MADRYFSNKLGSISEEDYNKYNKIYQDAFGSKTVAGIPTNNITEPEQLAAAQAIEKATGTVGKRGEELKSDYEKRKNDAIAKMEYNSRLIEGRDRKRAEQSAKNTSGNAFDEVPNVSLKSGGKIENGSVYDKNGNLYNGEIALKGEHLPASVITVLGKGGISIPPGKNVTVRVLNGQIQSIKPEGKNEINRQFMQNEQLKYNTEPQKGQQMKFGATDEKQQSKKTYTYKGKSYTEDQVKKAASNLRMTFDEYIKKYNLK